MSSIPSRSSTEDIPSTLPISITPMSSDDYIDVVNKADTGSTTSSPIWLPDFLFNGQMNRHELRSGNQDAQLVALAGNALLENLNLNPGTGTPIRVVAASANGNPEEVFQEDIVGIQPQM